MGEPTPTPTPTPPGEEVIEKLTFLDEVGVQKLAEAILKKSNTRISDRIVQELNDASDANHVVSAALLNTLLKARDTLIGANTTAIATNKTDADKLVSDVGDLTTKVDDNTTNVTAVAGGITALDEKIAGLTHLTIDMVVGPISGVTDPKSDVLYLQKDDEADTTWMLYIYREDNTWAQIGDTGVDLSDYWSKDDNAAIKDAVGVPEVTPLAEDKIIAALDAAFNGTDVLGPDPTVNYLDIRNGAVSASMKLIDAEGPIDLVIPSEINGIKVTSIGTAAFSGCSLRSVVISEGVTSIGTAAFQGCKSLISVIIPNTVTSIGSIAFQECDNIVSINIPSSVTSIKSDVFDACTALVAININKPQYSISGAPWGATNATVSWKDYSLLGIRISPRIVGTVHPTNVEFFGDGKETASLQITPIPADAVIPDDVINGATWTSSDTSIITTWKRSGNLCTCQLQQKEGLATITVTTTDGMSDSISFMVDATSTIEVRGSNADINGSGIYKAAGWDPLNPHILKASIHAGDPAPGKSFSKWNVIKGKDVFNGPQTELTNPDAAINISDKEIIVEATWVDN